ncbi:hypothetical protein CLV98_101152 [Dyadobacter jejuensis]|uniref:Uncharacterized protein n=2 Tax=Dyadobacter jejuensis TaxID=1082580 RepID=A0A316BBX2_9BACT|nr:hypothetical protein CLV98_101152 [Dyadobacter jejuensis]
MNAADEQERAAINLELKALYASLNEEEQKEFNTQLQLFLTKEMGRIKSDYESIQGTIHQN